MTIQSRDLNDGTSIPHIGFGTAPLRGPDCNEAVLAALENGFRLIDGAANYHNDVEIGHAVRDFVKSSGTPRDEIIVQTKVPSRFHNREQVLLACSDSRELLGVERNDVVLLHSPDPAASTYLDAWRTLVELRNSGAIRTIGVSNCSGVVIAQLIADSGVSPSINQLEWNPYATRNDVRAEDARLGIVSQAWNPTGGGSASVDPPWAGIAAAHRVTPDQVLMRWHLQLGNVPIPMSKVASKQRELIDVFDFELSAGEMAEISATPQLSPGGLDTSN